MAAPKTENNVTDVHNWPNLFFKYILGALLIIATYFLSGLIAEIKEFRIEMGNFRKELIGNAKDFQYLDKEFNELKQSYQRHIEQSDAEKKDLNRQIQDLRYQVKNPK